MVSALLKFYQFLKNLSSCSKEIQETKSKYPTMTDKNCNNLNYSTWSTFILGSISSSISGTDGSCSSAKNNKDSSVVVKKTKILVLAYYQGNDFLQSLHSANTITPSDSSTIHILVNALKTHTKKWNN